MSENIKVEGMDEKEDNSLEQYNKRLQALKEEIKQLKKIRKQQKKISKLEEERLDVLRDIEKRNKKSIEGMESTKKMGGYEDEGFVLYGRSYKQPAQYN